MNSPSISFVSPVYGNRASLRALCERIGEVASQSWPGDRVEIILVDDCSPDGAWSEIQSLASSMRHVRGLRLRRNAGQHVAVLSGFAFAKGQVVICLDGDLQDPPEAAPALRCALVDGVDVSFAGRRGVYQSIPAMITSTLYRMLILRLIGLPRDAGMYFACTNAAAAKLLDARVNSPSVIGLIAASLRCRSIPVERSSRALGVSSYDFSKRLRAARRALATYVLARRSDSAVRPVREQIAELIVEDTASRS
ncbi:MAG: hypothetical protein A2790_04960 [Phenylobacterium sp. RIFCSPHIGHO2_01_FULL_69_31]|uniref:glycosyltransferase n=1 Tax=Phenylobacterium sp. RIFCSPHIGHO2_01_FULL_69_31 TaxID=1801944 RepID=UPI0008BBCC96|nr:glycosyltransferase [Phenylobacterium sp. RIFCSPHIGHO2_01_FULL_69_31]OHB30093.1 MAG: hypothetical protein A2790_04960 [Phenylobacterium sp. RIFCSPHIGHO2_01_FULL_69_31]